ncbi:MAG: terpene cyclase/mutase family protein [Planctomycetes bacterium]|nr:terpene cyclase/mutase family protein [Planctomycetota bacterium]
MKHTKLILAFAFLALLCWLPFTSVYSADEETQKKINAAIDKGIKYLTSKGMKGREKELVVLTMLHAGVDPKKNGNLAAGIADVSKGKLQQVYNTAVTAMVLEMADRYKHQYRLAECAQALVDSQAQNGQWNYNCLYKEGSNLPVVTKESAKTLEAIITGEGETKNAKKEKEKPFFKIKVTRKTDQKKTQLSGDNSNTQFALLGLRSSARAGVDIPDETWQAAADWFEKNQMGDGGWGYSVEGAPDTSSYGSMTCAAVCGSAIAKFYLKKDITQDQCINRGLNWLGSQLKFDGNPGAANSIMKGWGGEQAWQYYYIYGVERVGAVLGVKQLGNRDWYLEGAKYLVENQSAKDGSWNAPGDDVHSTVIADTCFAILFLKLATPTLKANFTGDEPETKKE